MFDTVLIAARVMDPPRVASRLERAGAVSAYLREGGVIGRIGSLKVRQDEDLFRLRGSLTQFTGSTASSPTVVEEARGRLEELFGEHLEVAAVWRLDVFADVRLSRAPVDYCPLLLDYPRLERVACARASVRFECGRRTLAFYDKGAEQRKRGHPAPPGHVLRYELRYLKQIAAQLGRGICFSDLGDLSFRAWIADRWLAEYGRVRKARTAIPIAAWDHDVRSWERGLILSGLQALGETEALRALERGHDAGLISRPTYYRKRQWVRGLASDKALTEEHGAVKELDRRVREAAQLMREGLL